MTTVFIEWVYAYSRFILWRYYINMDKHTQVYIHKYIHTYTHKLKDTLLFSCGDTNPLELTSSTHLIVDPVKKHISFCRGRVRCRYRYIFYKWTNTCISIYAWHACTCTNNLKAKREKHNTLWTYILQQLLLDPQSRIHEVIAFIIYICSRHLQWLLDL